MHAKTEFSHTRVGYNISDLLDQALINPHCHLTKHSQHYYLTNLDNTNISLKQGYIKLG